MSDTVIWQCRKGQLEPREWPSPLLMSFLWKWKSTTQCNQRYTQMSPQLLKSIQNNNKKLYSHLACQVHYLALKCAVGTDRLMHPYLQQQLLTAHAEPGRGALEPRSTLSPGLPGPGFQSADSLSAKDKQFQFSKYKGSAYKTNPTCQFPLNIK